MRVLVTGGAGYIGSQMVRQLLENKIDVVVLDSLENGHRAAVPAGVPLHVGTTADRGLLDDVLGGEPVDAVMHFAGYLAVKESVEIPDKYFRNNVADTLELLDAMRRFDVRRFVFSSTAATYGNPTQVPIPEDHPKNPISPYGDSKWMVERILGWFDAAYGIRSISLRYFNAAGAALDGSHGEDHPDEPHIIPIALHAAREHRPFYIFGGDYPTPDGSCVRDYVHVIDLCDAHLLALDALAHGHATTAYNVGTGQGYSNRQVAQVAAKVTGIDFEVKVAARRPSDPAELVADSRRLRQEFGWQPRHSDLETIIQSAWKWHREHPQGYADRM